jgi:hypothetical protein
MEETAQLIGAALHETLEISESYSMSFALLRHPETDEFTIEIELKTKSSIN